MRALVAMMLVAASALNVRADDDRVKPPDLADFLVVPVRIHILTANDLPEVDCKLSDDDIERVIGKVNQVWRPAGIYFGLESIVREAAENQERFRTLRDEKGGIGSVPLAEFQMLMPRETRSKKGMDIYYIHKFSVNGVYLGDRLAFVQETAKLREVEGGIDEPLPRVTSHELGHALGLPHRQARTNLLASGTTGTSLNTDEIEKARANAGKVAGALSFRELKEKVDADPARADLLKRWINAIDSR